MAFTSSLLCVCLALIWNFPLMVLGSELTPQERDFISRYYNETWNQRPDIVMDEARLTINNAGGLSVMIYMRNQQCTKCNMLLVDTIFGDQTKTLVVDATFGTDVELRFGDSANTVTCRLDIKFKENGDYWLFHNITGSNVCEAKLYNDPMVAEMPILYTAAGIVGLWIIVKIAFIIYRKRKDDGSVLPPVTGANSAMELKNNGETDVPATTHSKKARLKSLDTLRGLSLVIMIFVNYGGGGYWFFGHLPWNGLTVADLVFPWFVFMMGASMNYSFKSLFKRGKSRCWILGKVLKRSILLFAFGIILNTNWGPVKLTEIRIPGVLQRLSLSYLFVALTETAFTRTSWDTKSTNKIVVWTRDILFCIPQWIVSLAFLGGYLGLTFGLPVPGCPTGYLGPGGLHDEGHYVNCTGGAAGYIDRLVLGDKHIYGNPTPKKIYQTTVPYDPEGILGTLTSIFLCFLGLQVNIFALLCFMYTVFSLVVNSAKAKDVFRYNKAGRIFVVYNTHKDRIIRLLIWTVITGAIGAGLCGCSLDDGIIPVNKNLWSVSYVMVTGCFGYFLLCMLYIVVDILRLWDGEPFIFTGMNPLVIYLCHDIFYRFFPVNFYVEPIHWQLLLKAVWDVLIWLTLGYVLYVKKIFIAL